VVKKYGKVFVCKKGKHRGKKVKYSYVNGKKSTKKLVLHKPRRRY
jgi:hypothetical protein